MKLPAIFHCARPRPEASNPGFVYDPVLGLNVIEVDGVVTPAITLEQCSAWVKTKQTTWGGED